MIKRKPRFSILQYEEDPKKSSTISKEELSELAKTYGVEGKSRKEKIKGLEQKGWRFQRNTIP